MAGGVHGRGVCMAGGGGFRGRRDSHCSGQYASYWNAFLFDSVSSIYFLTTTVLKE